MGRSSKVLATTLVVALLAVIGAAQGMPPAHMHEEGSMFEGHMLGFFADLLNLTDAQQAQIKQIMEKERPSMQPLREQERQIHHSMMQLVTSGSFDEAKAQTLAQQAGQVQTQLMVEHARTAAQAFQVLTPEQKTRFNEFLAKRQQRFQEHMKQHSGAEPESND